MSRILVPIFFIEFLILVLWAELLDLEIQGLKWEDHFETSTKPNRRSAESGFENSEFRSHAERLRTAKPDKYPQVSLIRR